MSPSRSGPSQVSSLVHATRTPARSGSPIFIDLQLLGSCFSSLTCGLLLSWAARYWALGYRDEWYLKAAVGIGSLYALIDTALNCSWAYRVGPPVRRLETPAQKLTSPSPSGPSRFTSRRHSSRSCRGS